MKTKLKFSQKRPKRSGTYQIKDTDGTLCFLVLYYSKETKDWWIFDYPNRDVSYPYDEKEEIMWGMRVE